MGKTDKLYRKEKKKKSTVIIAPELVPVTNTFLVSAL